MTAVVESPVQGPAGSDPNAPLRGAQRARVAVLARILWVPGLMPASWTVAPEVESGRHEDLRGQVGGFMPLWQAQAEIGAYAAALGLKLDKEKLIFRPGQAFPWTQVQARGVVDGVAVCVWAAGRSETAVTS